MTCVRRYQERWNLSGRIMGSLAVSLLTFVTCGIFVLAEEVNSTVLFFCTMGLIVISGLSTAVLQVRYRQQAPIRSFSLQHVLLLQLAVLHNNIFNRVGVCVCTICQRSFVGTP